MTMLTRRTFVETLCGVAATAMVIDPRLAVAASGARDAQPHVKFPTAPRERMAVAAWPFRAYIHAPQNAERNPNVPGMDLKDFAAYVVEKFNVHGIEPYNLHFSSLKPEYLASFREALAKANVRAVNIAVDQEKSFYDGEPATRRQAVAYGKQWVDVAVAIGSPSIRTNMAPAANTLPNVSNAVESLRELASYGAAKNVVVHLENDNLVSEDAFFVVEVIEGVNSPYLRALPDFANSMMSGDADFNYRAITAMFQHAYGICHVKDVDADEKGKEFPIDLEKTIGILKASGYHGYGSVEYSGLGNPHEPTKKLIERAVRDLS
jgi:sugar phosphate isomerase/epimerase